ncbi:MAG: CDP-alcohol phosphatidyltransferase family protein [Bacteroidales bacterium]|nr:CDP-alcohol phosphatidyltransferase family protein [Bacteroidales bacterium]MBQ5943417.1 CDP-alcohol phosphatidyltransferase family protein [Bacteroidales bacterium]
MGKEQSKRIQTSILNGVERKVLVWLAERQPRWVVSDTLTFVGFLGSVIIALGYILTNLDYRWLWLASLGFVINWYGDSLDGSVARVRKTQRPVYGFYIDHTMDVINEIFMLVGVGLSVLMRFDIAMLILVMYLALTINVDTNAHLKNEFKLTYGGFGPTEFRILVIIVNTLFIFIRPLREFMADITLFGHSISLSAMDIFGIAVLAILTIIYIATVVSDARGYAKADPMPERKD